MGSLKQGKVRSIIRMDVWHYYYMLNLKMEPTPTGVNFRESPLKGGSLFWAVWIFNSWALLESFTPLIGTISETPNWSKLLTLHYHIIYSYHESVKDSMFTSQLLVLITTLWSIKQSELTNQQIFINYWWVYHVHVINPTWSFFD